MKQKEHFVDNEDYNDTKPVGALVKPRDVNMLHRKPWVPFTIGDTRDGSNDYKTWPSKGGD